jgi:hypothetical protein
MKSESAWISLLLEGQRPVCRVEIAWADGDSRTYKFYIQVSPEITGEQSWTPALVSGESTLTTALLSYALAPTQASRVKITFTEIKRGPAPVQISEVKVFSNTL